VLRRLQAYLQTRESEPEINFEAQTFFDESRQEDRVALHRTIARWIVAFVVVFCFAAMAFWWSGSAVSYSTARVQNRSTPTYEITGVITDAQTHKGIAWADISTDFQFGGAFFSTTADQNGQYSITTLPEPHYLIVKANGYQSGRIRVGKQWFSWTPKGSEKRDAELTPSR
jgi:hypothetical protein